MNKYHFETRMQVRDYECDIEGIVNNAQYIHYCEHTRHLFLKECGLSFAEMHRKGVDAVVARMQLQYKVPLRPFLTSEISALVISANARSSSPRRLSARPSGVSVIWRLPLIINVHPNSSSSSIRALESGGCDRCRRSAARVMLRSSATVKK